MKKAGKARVGGGSRFAGTSLKFNKFSLFMLFPYSPISSYKGIFPCFLRGLTSRLVSSERKAAINFARVSAGSMTEST